MHWHQGKPDAVVSRPRPTPERTAAKSGDMLSVDTPVWGVGGGWLGGLAGVVKGAVYVHEGLEATLWCNVRRDNDNGAAHLGGSIERQGY